MKMKILKLLSSILVLILVIGCSNQSIDKTENTNDDPISSEEEIDDSQLMTLDDENNEIYYYICPIIMDINTGEFKDANALGLSDGMNIAILSTYKAIESEENLKDINGHFILVDFRDVPYETPEKDFDNYVGIYELIRDNDWYVWHYHTSDYDKSNLFTYDYELIYEDDDYIEFGIDIDNTEYYFRSNVFYTNNQLEQYN